MPACPSIFRPTGGSFESVLASLADRWPEFVEIVSKPVSIAIVAAGFFGLFVGMLLRGREKAVPSRETEPGPETTELRWRHEKLVLVERQQVEKQSRLEDFAARLAGEGVTPAGGVALRHFLLSERCREARQKVGTDLSRLKAVRDRLDECGARTERARETLSACRTMAEAQIARLDEVREALRYFGEEIRSLGRDCNDPDGIGSSGKELGRRIVDLKGRLLSLPQGWATAGEETDRRLRELLETVDEPALRPVREILLLDGASTSSLEGGNGLDLAGAAGALAAAMDRATAAKRVEVPPQPDTSGPALSGLDPDFGFPGTEVPGTEVPGTEVPEPPVPDSGFREIPAIAVVPLRPPKGFHDLTEPGGNGNGAHGDKGAAAVVEAASGDGGDLERSLVLFCSNDVELWGQTVYRGARCRARAIAEFPGWARWISIRRLDTHERVFAPIRTASLQNGKSSVPFGFNGSNELFYGARHLGLFSESCPNEVETRFTYGGWGFGHRAHEIAPDVEQLQAAGWEGREIPSDTVFEIVIHEELPSLGSLDRLLEGEVTGLS